MTAGLFLRALARGRHADPGFDAAGVSVAARDAEAWGYDEPKARAFYQALRERMAALPGVSAASYAEFLPLVMHQTGDEIQLDGAGPAGGAGAGGVPVSLSVVDVGYFAALRLPLVRGRAFGAVDGPGAPRVAVVNATLARRHWPDGEAVGRTFGFHGERVTVVGVARDAKYATLAEPPTPMVYFPLAQQWRPARVLVVRAAAGPAQLAPAIARAVAALDPAVPRPVVTSLRAENGVVLLPQRAAALVAGAMGAAGLLLASVGLYGVIAYAVGRRRREIAIRVAVGARRRDVVALVVGDGMRLAALGVLLGVALGMAATRLLRGLLFDVSPLDAATFAATSALLAAVALVAIYLPAHRAAAVDPQAVLRAE